MATKKITAIIAVMGIIATSVAMLLPTEAGTEKTVNTTEPTTSVVYSSAAPAAVETATDAETTTGNVSVKSTPVVYQETDRTSSSISSVPIKAQTTVLPTESSTKAQPDMSGFKNDYYISEFSQYNDYYITGAFGNKGMFGYVVITPNGAIQQYAVGFAPDWVVENCSKESNDIKINFDKYQMDTESKDIIQNVCGSVITTLKFNDDIYILSLNKSHYGLIKNGGKTTIETDSLSTLFESVYLL